MKKIAFLILLPINLFSLNFFVQSEVYPGHPITTVISPVDRDTEYSIYLELPQGKRIDINVFDYYIESSRTHVLLGLSGIPLGTPPGEYKAFARAKGLVVNEVALKSFRVLDFEYEEKVIKANNIMGSIALGKRTPEREEQAIRWYDTISSFSRFSRYFGERFTLPVEEGRVSSPFGVKRTFVYPQGREAIDWHRGHDYPRPPGTPVVAPGRGAVRLSENRIVTGNTVIIEHLPGVFSLYYHLNSRDVTKGHIVKKGDRLGTVGSTGFSTGSHLHWEIKINTISVSPIYFLETPIIDKTLIMNMINSTNTKKGG